MRFRLLICDLDNTLYDWVGFFIPSLYAMIDETVRILECDRDELLDDLRTVHQRYHDAEHPFSLLETKTVDKILSDRTIRERREILDPAFKIFNSTRKRSLHLYPGVETSLARLVDSGVTLVAHTESRFYAVAYRMRSLNLTSYFSKIYCRERPEHSLVDPQRASASIDGFFDNQIVELSMHQRKPDPSVIHEICSSLRILEDDAAYIGDSLSRDVMMAKISGVQAIWARYGTKHSPDLYAKLVRISHWTADEVAREKDLEERAKLVVPDFTANNSFDEILELMR